MDPSEPTVIFQQLRRLAATDPRAARSRITDLLNGDVPQLDEVLRLASAPGEGRLRQFLAQVGQSRPDKARLVPHLLRWLEHESDEFARAAIQHTLNGVDATAYRDSGGRESRHLVEVYRYAADRLCHRLRNSLTGLPRHLRRLDALLSTGSGTSLNAEAGAVLDQLKDALREVSRVAEFDIEDTHFEWRVIELGSWLRKMNEGYRAKYTPISLSLVGPLNAGEVRIRANDLHLDTLFWNIWKNAQQAVSGACEITIRSLVQDGRVEILILDNGGGFSADDAELAFVNYFQDHGLNYGRGLLEAHDAVARLNGTAQVVHVGTDGYRIKLTFPLAIV